MQGLSAVTSMQLESIEQVQAIIENVDTPIVFTGLCADFPIVKAGLKGPTQAMEYVSQFYGGQPLTAYRLDPQHKGRVFYNDQIDGFNYQAGKADLPFILDTLKQQFDVAEPYGVYMGSTEINQYFPGFGEQNSLSLAGIKPLASLWLGNQTKVAAHFDFPHNLACNLVGQRTFTLFPPEQIGNLYIGPMEFAPGGQEISMVDFDTPDFARFPKFKQALASAFQVTLNPGDVLFIPSMWWHHVKGEQNFNVLLTHWWRDTPAYLGRPNNALIHSMLSLRSLPKAQRQAWKAFFDHYIFDHDATDTNHIPDAAKGMLSHPIDELNARKLRAELTNKLKR
ncbi:cupin-like domain-containing protein [Shewanella maritima]|uniref:cupin-like domain-containing protein n=1 Tax=Shewanella maritima TaxID=2520507 RepID=UPI003734DC74